MANEKTTTMTLTFEQVRTLEHMLREWKEPYGPHRERGLIWRKMADAMNRFDDEEYRRLYGCPLPGTLRK